MGWIKRLNKVRRENDYYGRSSDLERLIHSVNFEDLDSIRYFQRC